ncbi:MAG: LacI family transcriptional regulator [Treponema sp.]|jgi:LacI family transcriptional regulator|nr:LacI family transcriptional regulator [Treponema sp.]
MSNIKDVAKMAAVSAITVSRVINFPHKVRPETRKRVEEAMRETKYVPNRAAKNLVAGQTGIIDVYIPENVALSNPFMMFFITGISEALGEKMYSFLIKRSWNVEHNCDGYIVTGLLTDEINDFYAYAKERGRPVALFGHTDIEEVDCLDVDNVLGASMAVSHLIENGHTSIGMINVAEKKDYTMDRYRGYRLAMKNAGLPPGRTIRAANSFNGGYRAVQKLLSGGPLSAVFCASDVLAIGAINGMADAGLRVPKDISVIGYDGMGHHLLTDPHITTIVQPVIEIGRALAMTLTARISGETNRTFKLIPPRLYREGKTVAAPAG